MAVKMEGPLTKWTNVVQGWQYRWFVLDEFTGLLSYYTSKDKMMRGARRGCLRLKGGKIGINDEDDSTFTITCDHRTFHFQARDAEERTQWVKCLEETITSHTNGGLIGSSGVYSIPTEEELNRRMQEAEAYFRILTQQVKQLESQINHSNNSKSERSMMLKDSLTQMIETMGQTIELLHDAKISLAKKVPVPVVSSPHLNKTTKPPLQHKSSDLSEKSLEQNSSDISCSPARSVKSRSSSGTDNVEVACEATESGNQITKTEKQALEECNKHAQELNYINLEHSDTNYPPAIVPISSYTSSDEEDIDEFYDANEQFSEITVEDIENSLKLEEEQLYSKTKTSDNDLIDLNLIEQEEKTDEKEKSIENQKEIRQSPDAISTESDEFDKDDQNTDDEESDDMQQHGSVITHLLSQVRIGMDLTKVTLPTFILERRSLLEMYADFYAHPDLFKGVPDLADPGDRMIQVLRWYLSSFHAGRKGSVAKKPYNPILGETFQCFFNLTDDQSKRKTPEHLSTDGPIPWATEDDVTFVAEQVSHHPPISAFYAECENKRVCFNSHIWTKSKFLGLSIGVHMYGTAHLFVSDHDEEYIVTFPNAYGRSILTVPWIELGGKTEILCPKSGYSVQIDFLTKPFYGGKKNRVTAEVFAPNQKKAFMSVNGEWNGIMYAKYANKKEPEVFVDTFNMSIIKKKVKVVDQQEEFESRRLWKDVTVSLQKNLIENASASKHKLEEKQRQDARVRKETNTRWVTRLFDEWDDGTEHKYFYKWPLYKRLGLPKPGASA